jgi:ribonucleoside-diphosphate reductase, adenosylcobalamin-dependent
LRIEEWLPSKLGQDIWHKKYQHNGETFDQWLDRVSGGDTELKEMIVQKKFLFGGRILSNRGIPMEEEKSSLSNCYVMPPVEDNIESIYETCKKLARTYSYGGGCGVDISKLSPAGAKVRNQAGETSGAVSFMSTFSQVTEQIGQNKRRGALMISLDCTHPDVIDFINVKTDLTKVTKANISVRVSDAFMDAVINDEDWELFFERPETGERISRIVKANHIFELLCKNNWEMGEPGILFWDRVKDWNLLANNPEFEYAGVNPCAEESLPAGGSCLLGSLNLSEFVVEDHLPPYFDYNKFSECVRIAVRALNDVLDEGIERHPLEEQQQSVSDWRQIGLGVMGIADMLIKLGIRYGSDSAIHECGGIARCLLNESLGASAKLAEAFGTYPKYTNAVLASKFFEQNKDYYATALVKEFGLRNSQLLTIAPTGTISTMLGISGGIEPIYANSYTRKTESLHGEDTYYKVYTPIVEEYMNKHNLTDESQLPDYFVTASEIPYSERIEMQSVWQTYIDAAISSTINLPNSATVEDIENLYILAWEKGLKGITVFRDGCSRAGILTTDNNTKPTGINESLHTAPSLGRGDVIQVNDDVIGKKRKLITGCGSLHCSAFFDPQSGDLVETYLSKGSEGGCLNFATGLSRMISYAVRSGADFNGVIDQLKSCGACPSYAVRAATKKDTSKGSCCPIAISYALKEMHDEVVEELLLNESSDESTSDVSISLIMDKPKVPACPECGEGLFFEGGCNVCKSCGWSKCE